MMVPLITFVNSKGEIYCGGGGKETQEIQEATPWVCNSRLKPVFRAFK